MGEHAALRTIVGAAAPLFERRCRAYVRLSDRRAKELVEERVEERFARWRACSAGGDELGFDRRLAFAGLDRESARECLYPVELADDAPLPAWLGHLRESTKLAMTLGLYPEAAARIPFAELVEPFVRIAARRLIDRHPESSTLFAPTGLASLEDLLRVRLGKLAGRSLLGALHSDRAGSALDPDDGSVGVYRRFCRSMLAGGLVDHLLRAPVLGRLIGAAIEQWIDACAKLCGDLRRDSARLSERFGGGAPLGRVTACSSTLSGPRDGGRAVVRLTFESGIGLYYKPRSLAVDAAFTDLIAWLGERHPSLRWPAPKMLSEADHGWMAIVTHRGCEDRAGAERYYRRAGALLRLLVLCRGRDIHAANLIAVGDTPCAIDLEMLLQEGGTTCPLRATGMLPSPLTSVGQGGDMSGLAGSGEEPMAVPIGRWHGLGSDAIGFSYIRARTPATANRPTVGGATIHLSQHQDALVDGYAAAHRALAEERQRLLADDGPLRAFAGVHVGRTPRPPQAYASLLEHTQHPRYLQDGLDRSIELERLAAPVVLSGCTDDGGLLAAEHTALERGDIPRFSAATGSRDKGPFVDLLRRIRELDPDPAPGTSALTALLAEAIDPA